MGEKLSKILLKLCDVFEFFIAVLVGIGLIVALISYIPGIALLFKETTETTQFLHFLEDVFNLVVGLEFMKMLCKPSSDNVIEVLIFLVSRHMIIADNNAMDIFLSVISIILLFITRRGLHMIKYSDIILEARKKKYKKIKEQEEQEEIED